MKLSFEFSRDAVDFIDDDALLTLLERSRPDKLRIRDIVAKSLSKTALTVPETADLLRTEDLDLIDEILQGARTLKETVYGNRIVLFAPLYIGNDCINDCYYCAFKRSNQDVIRRTLSESEIHDQVKALENNGHKRLILVFGEHPKYDPEYIAECVRTVYDTQIGRGSIRRLNINAAPLNHEGFRLVKEAGIGTYQIFQETYHHDTYRKMHPANTRKGNYLYRLDGLNRAFEAGCDDMGIGALFGLFDWRFEVLGLVTHALHLQKRFNVGPHTISFPRCRPAAGVELPEQYAVNDEEFKRLIAILRLAVPYTGLILTAREKPGLRREVMHLGVSQIDAGSRIEIGAYTEAGDTQCMEREQFSLGDIRSLDDVIHELLEDGFIPSFCTACYRLGRTGEHFMEFAIPGFIKRYCTLNALSTLKEFLVDYASDKTLPLGNQRIREELDKIGDEKMKQELSNRLKRIEAGERDLCF
jgi:2-iminoacetate synthase